MVDAQAVAAAARRQIEAEAVGGAAHQGTEGARQGRVELLGRQHPFQQQVGVVAHLVQVVAGGGHQQAHHLAARRRIAVRLGTLGKALQAAHGRDADGLVEIQRSVGAARVQLPQQGLPPCGRDSHRSARRRHPLRRSQSRGGLADGTKQGLQGGAVRRVERLQVGVAGLDRPLLQAQHEGQGGRQGAATAALLGSQNVEQPQSEVDGGGTRSDRSRPHPRHHRGGFGFVEAGGVGPLADQHEAAAWQGLADCAAGQGECLVNQPHRGAEPLHQPLVAAQALPTRRTLLRRRRHRRIAHGGLQAPSLPRIGRGPLRARHERKRALLGEGTADRRPHRRFVELRNRERCRQAGSEADAHRCFRGVFNYGIAHSCGSGCELTAGVPTVSQRDHDHADMDSVDEVEQPVVAQAITVELRILPFQLLDVGTVEGIRAELRIDLAMQPGVDAPEVLVLDKLPEPLGLDDRMLSRSLCCGGHRALRS